MARGFTQRRGIDFEQTFSPVVHFTTIRTMLAIATAKGMKTCQMSGSTFNIPVSFSVITGFSGGSYAPQDATVSSNLYDCIYTSFEFGEVDKQYLFNVNA